MLPHQERVVTEKKELDEKLAKLKAFFDKPTFGGLSLPERYLLMVQYDTMEHYSDILKRRIAEF